MPPSHHGKTKIFLAKLVFLFLITLQSSSCMANGLDDLIDRFRQFQQKMDEIFQETAPPDSGTPSGKAAEADSPLPFDTVIQITLRKDNKRMNRLIFGNNIQWVDKGDGILNSDGTGFSGSMLSKVKKISPTVLRYPGGSQSDLYHWRDGVGDVKRRDGNLPFGRNKKQKVFFGTKEFLELCEFTGAQPLITVNIITGSASDAAAWVSYINKQSLKSSRTGNRLPRATFWEIGNEPYLQEGNRALWIKPEEYARRATRFIRAMKKVDPSIKVGIALRSDTIGGVPATPYQGYNQVVLKGLRAGFDYVATHNTYMPFLLDNKAPDKQIYRAIMAAPRAVANSIDGTGELLKRYFPDKNIKTAVTEYNALFTYNKSRTDRYTASLGGALYVADILRLFANMDDVLFANYWSLSDNWYFGAVTSDGYFGSDNRPRPVYYVLAKFRKMIDGDLLRTAIRTGTFTNRKTGLVPPMKDSPLVTGISVSGQDGLRVMLINKDAGRPSRIAIVLPGQFNSGSYYVIGGKYYFSGAREIKISRGKIEYEGRQARMTLPPHSVAFLHFR